jgi:hypothetical protein
VCHVRVSGGGQEEKEEEDFLFFFPFLVACRDVRVVGVRLKVDSYCSNLPFSFEDADLKKIFAGFEVTSAYVAVRRNGRSKGFGEFGIALVIWGRLLTRACVRIRDLFDARSAEEGARGL